MNETPQHNYRYKPDCIFCKIVAGEIQTPGIFWEDDLHLAMLSIDPNTEGFSVVIPKNHYDSDVMHMDDEALCAFILASKKVAGILESFFDDVGRIGIVMEGTGVDHAHIKLIPMHNTPFLAHGQWKPVHNEGPDQWFDTYPGYLHSGAGPSADPEHLSQLAEAIKQHYRA